MHCVNFLIAVWFRTLFEAIASTQCGRDSCALIIGIHLHLSSSYLIYCLVQPVQDEAEYFHAVLSACACALLRAALASQAVELDEQLREGDDQGVVLAVALGNSTCEICHQAGRCSFALQLGKA